MVLCRAKTKTCYSVFSSGTSKRFAYSSSRDSCSGSRYVKFTHHLLHSPCPCRMTAISQPCWPYHVNNRLNNECYRAFKNRARSSSAITACNLSAFLPVSFETAIAFCIAFSNNVIKYYHSHYRQYILRFTQSVLICEKIYLVVGGTR